ncbi:MAG: hypothetical protein J6M44_11940 [Butyrivibrio sp.]|nr:hypothetical protein [Butyrivibrio sp.]
MTKEKLEQLVSLRSEIVELEFEIVKLQDQCKEVVTDKVMGSSLDFPYTQKPIIIRGYNIQRLPGRQAAIQRRMNLITERRQQVLDLELEISEYINHIHNSEIRRIFHLRYERGHTWEQVGEEMHCHRSTAEKKVDRYLKLHQ